MSKLFDGIITKQLSKLFNPLFALEQHGFVAARSTETNLAFEFEFVYSAFSKYSQVDTFYNDLLKAFDSVNHNLLLRKLENYGVVGNMLKWIESYFKGRSAQTRIKNHVSDPFDILSGVPQGSHLGPLLFIIFINDITQVVKYSKIFLYADDAKIFKNIKSVLDCIKLQRDIDAVAEWCSSNALKLNIEKCHTMNFCNNYNQIEYPYSIGNSLISKVNSLKDLGVVIDSKLNFKKHVWTTFVQRPLRSLVLFENSHVILLTAL